MSVIVDRALVDPPWEPDMGRFARGLAAALEREGHPWPDLAAALLTARGRAGLSRQEFGAWLGLSEPVLAALEDGRDLEPRSHGS